MLILMIGIPGSGKTTLRNKITSGMTLICPDDFIGYTKRDPWTPRAAREAWRKADILLKECLQKGEELIVFDATFVNPKKRSKYIRMAQKYNTDIAAIYCQVPLSVAIQRNASRDFARQVPEDTIKSMNGRLKPPQKEEGFKYVLTFDSETNKLKGDILPRVKAFLEAK